MSARLIWDKLMEATFTVCGVFAAIFGIVIMEGCFLYIAIGCFTVEWAGPWEWVCGAVCLMCFLLCGMLVIDALIPKKR